MKVIFFLAVLFAIAASELAPHYSAVEFGKFVQKFGKSYESSAEESFRFRVFQKNLEFIQEHNEKNLPFKLAVNHFADLSFSEFRERFLGFRLNATRNGGKHVHNPKANLPTSVDWRTKGAVTPVKDQGQCGSCWSFSTTGSVEGAWFLSKGQLVSLSEQNLVDCSSDQGNNGCNGGLMDNAFNYIISNKGIDSEKSYPYKAQDGRCKFKQANIAATISSFNDVNSGDESGLLSAVAQQPVSVAIDASHRSFQFYSSGVYFEPQCSSDQLDHGVLAVGYGTENGKDYWLVKNSWAASWGDQGYIKMARNKNNNCGIATSASYPIV